MTVHASQITTAAIVCVSVKTQCIHSIHWLDGLHYKSDVITLKLYLYCACMVVKSFHMMIFFQKLILLVSIYNVFMLEKAIVKTI